jgi:hypothetical protein
MLSASLIAYYGHIRASAGHDGFMFLCPPLLDPQKVPTFICQSLMTCRRPYSDGSSDPPTNQIADLAFTPLIKVRQPFAPHTGLRVVISRSCNVHIPLRPVILLAPLRTGLLRPSLPAPDRSKGRSVITTGTFVSFLTGLAPAALPALWAAHQGNQING